MQKTSAGVTSGRGGWEKEGKKQKKKKFNKIFFSLNHLQLT